jgi:hypothetical protein
VMAMEALTVRPGLVVRRAAPTGSRCTPAPFPLPRATHAKALRVKYHEDEDEVMGSDWSASWSLKSYEVSFPPSPLISPSAPVP